MDIPFSKEGLIDLLYVHDINHEDVVVHVTDYRGKPLFVLLRNGRFRDKFITHNEAHEIAIWYGNQYVVPCFISLDKHGKHFMDYFDRGKQQLIDFSNMIAKDKKLKILYKKL